MTGELSVRFWGVRGSVACAGSEYLRYGGNTPCIEIAAGGRRLVFDAGTGIRPLGIAMGDADPLDIDLFFSHTHFDHIGGLSFFAPLFSPGNRIRMWTGHLLPDMRMPDVLRQLMAAPLYPVSVDIFKAAVQFNDFRAGETLNPAPGIVLRTAPLNHPNGATGYNTDEEYPRYRGWGHSTWQEGVRIADAAGVGTLAIFHHDPSHDDDFMDGVAAAAARARPGTNANGLPRVVVTHEGLVLAP
ncbi:MAG: MBL fold metallo-hydrolase [Rhodospirillales bacterium]|nr:MAG: MBL fold metallo-hydrolase [Rhodospirillales bacterium]